MECKLSCLVFVLGVFLAGDNLVLGQKVYQYNSPGSNCHCEMMFEQTNPAPKAVIVLDAEGVDLVTFSKTNPYVASGLFTNYNFLYINVLNAGNSSSMDCYEIIIRAIAATGNIFLSSFYLIQKPEEDNLFIQKPNQALHSFSIFYLRNNQFNQLFTALEKATLRHAYKPTEKEAVNPEEEYDKKMLNYKRNFDVGLFYNPLILTGKKLGLDKPAINTYWFSMMKNVGHQTAIRLSIGGALKKPDVNSLRSKMQSQMMEAVQNGEDSIIIDEEMSGHIYFGTELSIRHYFTSSKQFRQYIGVGLGMHAITRMGGRIQDTIDISDIDMSNPSSMSGGGLNPDESGAGITMTANSHMASLFEYGFEYRLAPAAKLNVSLPMRYYSSPTAGGTLAFGVNIGLTFTLNPSKMPKLKQKR